MGFLTTWRPSSVLTAGADGELVEGLTVMVPRTMVPLPPAKIERCVFKRLPGSDGVGALLMRFLTGLVSEAAQLRPPDSARLGNVLVELLSATLARQLDADASLPPETGRRTLLMRVRAYIHERLDDPDLSPDTIAAAHHLSTRSLHRLFQDEEQSVSAWIRSQRLSRCRDDLADSSLRDRPIHAIAARWCLPNTAHFSRAFRAAYGLSPREYRRNQQAMATASPDPASFPSSLRRHRRVVTPSTSSMSFEGGLNPSGGS
jgi:AraC-like DNA-binding protein